MMLLAFNPGHLALATGVVAFFVVMQLSAPLAKYERHAPLWCGVAAGVFMAVIAFEFLTLVVTIAFFVGLYYLLDRLHETVMPAFERSVDRVFDHVTTVKETPTSKLEELRESHSALVETLKIDPILDDFSREKALSAATTTYEQEVESLLRRKQA